MRRTTVTPVSGVYGPAWPGAGSACTPLSGASNTLR